MSRPEGARRPSRQTSLQETGERVAQLEENKRLQDQILQLQDEIPKRGGHRGSRKRRHSHSSDSDQGHGGEIELKNIPQLSQPINARKRLDWIYDLQDAFAAAPRRFRKDRVKILYAVDHMHNNCKARWRQCLEERTSEDRAHHRDDWSHFREWTLVLIKDAASREDRYN